jgi:transcriptional regulator with XRE-family HTH domain
MTSTTFKKLLDRAPEDAKAEVRLSIEIAERILHLMADNNMTKAELAQKMGESSSEVNHWFSGMHTFTTRTLAKLHHVFGQPIIAVDKGFDVSRIVIY